MDIDLSFINKPILLPQIELVGLGKNRKNHTNLLDCYDCDNCYSAGRWIPKKEHVSAPRSNDCDCSLNCDCDCNNNCDCNDDDCDCSNDCNPMDDYINDCYIDEDEDNWYPGGWNALCG